MTHFTSLKNGSASVLLGRGLAHRHDDVHERAELACDAVCATRPFVPSHGQASQLFRVPLPVLREHLKARQAAGEIEDRGAIEDRVVVAIERVGETNTLVDQMRAASLGTLMAALHQVLAERGNGHAG